MVNPEQLISENTETGETPEKIVEKATEEVVSTAEIQEAVDPDSGHTKRAKDFIKEKYGKFYNSPAGRPIDVARVGGFTILKMLWGMAKFAKKAIEKKGNITFKEGHEIGRWITDTESKRDKK